MSERADSYVGKRVTMRIQRDGKPERWVQGTVTKVDYPYSVIRDAVTGEEWPSVRFLVKPDDGSRAVWSPSMPDKPPNRADKPPDREPEAAP